MFLEKNRERIHREYQAVMRELPGISREMEGVMETLKEEERLAMEYLYANMPLSDVGNYPPSVYLDFAGWSVYLWKHFSYVRELPEDIFLNYVLYHRVNEEEMKPCRRLFGELLLEEIAGLGLEQAVLKSNVWCAREVTYQSTDERTRSALDVYLCGSGRCGEESVFAVNAFRSAGIPARQVYATKWSHCDDNHAWVEVWCGGSWHYLGACEPEAVWDKGWFDQAASRAMSVSSRCFDQKIPEEDVIGRDGINIMLNQLTRYADTRRITIQVKDPEGLPADGAEVWGEVLNYSAFAPIVKLSAGADGTVSFVTGLGSLRIGAVWKDRYGECLIDTRNGTDFSCVVGDGGQAESSAAWESRWVDFDMIAPGESAKAGRRGFEDVEDATLASAAAAAREHCRRKRKEFQPLWKTQNPFGDEETAEKYMAVLSEKDRSDAGPEVLREHFEEARVYQDRFSEELFLFYIWNPRVEDEVLTCWRKAILGYFDESKRNAFRRNPPEIWRWIRANIRSRDERERLSVYTVPAAALKLGIAGERSKKLLFVAIARTLGIPARLNPQDQEIEYWEENGFICVSGERRSAHLILESGRSQSWTYFQNWSLSRKGQSGYYPLNLRELVWQPKEQGMDGAQGQQEYEGGPSRLDLDLLPGQYRILTSNRLPSGDILGKRCDFQIREGETRRITLELRQAEAEDMLSLHQIPDFLLDNPDGTKSPVSKLTAEGKHILFWLDVGGEPTEHILNELMERRREYAKYQERLHFILRNQEALRNPTLKKCREALPKERVCFDSFGKNRELTARSMYADPEKLPLLVMTEGACRGIFDSGGYSVGVAGLLLRILNLPT